MKNNRTSSTVSHSLKFVGHFHIIEDLLRQCMILGYSVTRFQNTSFKRTEVTRFRFTYIGHPDSILDHICKLKQNNLDFRQSLWRRLSLYV